MPSIGSYSFTAWQGRLRPGEQMNDVLAPQVGVDGVAVTLGGWRAEPQEIVTRIDFPTLQLALSTINGYRALTGQSVQVVDQFNIGWSSVFVLNVSFDYDQLISGLYRVTARWQLIPQSYDATISLGST